jgi:hypothetical protein
MVTQVNSLASQLAFVDKIRGRRRSITETIRLVNSIAANTAYVEQFGAIGNGTTDDSAAFQSAIDSLGTTGGKIILSNDRVYRIASNITIKPSCHLEGQQNMIGSNGYNYFTNYNAIGGSIRLDSRATINMRSGSSISKMLIRQSNLNYLSPTSFAGTAITISGSITNLGNTAIAADDTSVSDVMILGFNQAIFANNSQRLRVTQCNIDSNNGILVNSAYDVPVINRVHCWPFATIAAVARGWAPNPGGNALTRVGTAYKFQNTVDWGKITDSFSYGYQRGFWVDSSNSCELTGCGADNVPEAGAGGTGQSGDIGFLVTGGSTDTLLTNCQSASNEKGFYINTLNNLPTQLTNCVGWYNRDHGVLVEGGDVTVLGGIYRNSQYGIKVDSASSNINLQTIRFSDISTKPVFSAGPSIIMEGIHFENWTNSSPAIFPTSNITVPVSNVLTIPNEGKFFNVTSASGLGNVQYGWPGRTVTFKFNSNIIVLQSTGDAGGINLKSTANTMVLTNGTLTIVSDGTSWYET